MKNNLGEELQKRKIDYTYLRGEDGKLDINEVSRELKLQSYELAKKIKPVD